MERITLEIPPLPQYVLIGRMVFSAGERHLHRQNIGIFDWLFVVKGALHIGEEEKKWTLEKGQSLLLLPDRRHYATAPCEEETIFYWIHFHFDGSLSDEDRHNRTLPVRSPWTNPYRLELAQFATPKQFAKMESLLQEMMETEDANASYWVNQQRFMELLSLVKDDAPSLTSLTPSARLAERTEAYLRRHYAEEMTNETLATALHFHANYIVRCMKEVYGCTPMDYLHQYRMEQAKLLLVKTSWTVSDIAERVGFRYANYFSNCFKRYTGLRPLHFRKQNVIR